MAKLIKTLKNGTEIPINVPENMVATFVKAGNGKVRQEGAGAPSSKEEVSKAKAKAKGEGAGAPSSKEEGLGG